MAKSKRTYCEDGESGEWMYGREPPPPRRRCSECRLRWGGRADPSGEGREWCLHEGKWVDPEDEACGDIKDWTIEGGRVVVKPWKG